MTPRQRRQHNAAIEKAASAPRKSWLGKYKPITSIQSAWVKSLLTVWGEGVRGGTAPKMPHSHSCWHSLKGGRWSDKALEKFTAALNQARDEGFRGQQALDRARDILWPPATTSIIDAAIHNDDVDFVESCVLNALDQRDPVFVVGVDFYARKKRVSEIGRYLQWVAPWLTRQQAEDRVRWCISHFNCAVFLEMKKALEK